MTFSGFLCRTAMRATDVQDTLNLALITGGLDEVNVLHHPRLLSDYGTCYISGDPAKYLTYKGMTDTRGAPFHPQTQGKIERWHQTLEKPHPVGKLLPARLSQRG